MQLAEGFISPPLCFPIAISSINLVKADESLSRIEIAFDEDINISLQRRTYIHISPTLLFIHKYTLTKRGSTRTIMTPTNILIFHDFGSTPDK